MLLFFSGRNVTNKLSGVSMPLDIEFSAYNSAPFRSGAYLFQTDPSKEAESEVGVSTVSYCCFDAPYGKLITHLLLSVVWRV